MMSSPRRGVGRRGFIKSLLALVVVPWRTLLARPFNEAGYTRLKQIVSIPLAEIQKPWTHVSFDAMLDGAGDVNKILKGVLVRTDQTDGENFHAFCMYCPHEVCMVELKQDTDGIRLDRPEQIDHPVFVCPCHFSVFDPLQQGASISGPAYRGLYRFYLEETEDSIEIIGVEDGVLDLYN